MGSMGNRYKVSQHLVLPGRQREQGCGCCLSLIEKGFRAAWRGEVGGGLAGLTQEAKF